MERRMMDNGQEMMKLHGDHFAIGNSLFKILRFGAPSPRHLPRDNMLHPAVFPHIRYDEDARNLA